MSSFETPFGYAKETRILGKGITVYILEEDEQYIFLLQKLNKKIPKKLREESGWYPKIPAYILPIEFPQFFNTEECKAAHSYYRMKFPSMYEELIGSPVFVLPTKLTSIEKHRETFLKRNKNKYLEIAAWSYSENVPTGYVLVKATLIGDVDDYYTYFLVDEHEYLTDNNEYGFICVPGKHEERELID